MEFFDTSIFSYLILPLVIFLARIADVSLGTLRIIFVLKGMKRVAPFIGFFEILIWLIAISRIFQDLDNWVAYIAYAGGFAAGNYFGILLEERFAIGHGTEGDVGVLFVIVKRSMIKKVIEIINNYNPRALYTVEPIRLVNREVFHQTTPPPPRKSLLHKQTRIK